ncbi:hypothetical protein [Yinghuangia soli]|uniref:Lipoprotein n=1 Tax=Yinghuangia soli TaxID=2908204 RepID=A0AA41Q830_9ACTN|nr:hypothetical protein [Yinghuangia soli]MCF2532461.1 hypothetical protein [Yinghuangia soli]
MKRLCTVAGALAVLSACMLSSDPTSNVVGVRWEDDRLVAFLPVCPGDRLQSVKVYNETDPAVRSTLPPPIWTGDEPRDPAVMAGEFVLNGENDFARTTGPPVSDLPADISVEYRTARGWGASMRVRAAEVPRSTLAADEYWTTDGTKSRDQLLKQFPCEKVTPTTGQ